MRTAEYVGEKPAAAKSERSGVRGAFADAVGALDARTVVTDLPAAARSASSPAADGVPPVWLAANQTPPDGPSAPSPATADPPRDHVCPDSISGTAVAPSRRAAPPPPSRVLIAEDDAVTRTMLERTLRGWGYGVAVAQDGTEAWHALAAADAPPLAVLDWMMPGVEGPELCRRARALARPVPTYLILLTARGGAEHVAAGLDSGADDYMAKPFDRQELRSRLRVGERVLALQQGLADRVRDLEAALGLVKELKGLLPICSYCKAIRDDHNYWHRLETYIAAHSSARFSHGICPGCWKDVVEPDLAALAAKTEAPNP